MCNAAGGHHGYMGNDRSCSYRRLLDCNGMMSLVKHPDRRIRPNSVPAPSEYWNILGVLLLFFVGLFGPSFAEATSYKTCGLGGVYTGPNAFNDAIAARNAYDYLGGGGGIFCTNSSAGSCAGINWIGPNCQTIATGAAAGATLGWQAYGGAQVQNGVPTALDDTFDYLIFIQILGSTTCEDMGYVTLPSGQCDTNPPPDPCANVTQGWFSCTGTGPTPSDALSDASLCGEGAVTAGGCELDITPGGGSPECYDVTQTIAQGGNGIPTFRCLFDLTPAGPATPGSGLPEVDAESNFQSETVNESETTTNDPDDCDEIVSRETSFTGYANGTIQRCDITTTTKSGPNCATPGTTTTEDCSVQFSDGSQTNTTTTSTTDGNGNPTGSTTSTTNTGPAAEEPEAEGNYQYGGQCNTPPACSGDALLCGVVEQTWLDHCRFQNEVADMGTTTFNAPTIDTVNVTDLFNDIVNSNGFIGNRSCPTVPAIQIRGTTLQWDFTPLCTIFGYLSYLVLTFAGFRSLSIVMGGFQ